MVSLTSIPGNMTEQVILEITSKHIKKVMRNSQDGFIKGKSYFINQIAFDETTGLVDEGRATDVAYLVFSNAFDTQNILRDKSD